MSHVSEHGLWQRAASFAARCHQGQLRNDGITPYVAHPFRVALTVRHVFGVDDPVTLAAALLHDVIEDTPTDYDDLLEAFGAEVADAVALLTKDMRRVEPVREIEYDRQLATAPWYVKLIKLADVYDNLTEAPPGSKIATKLADKAARAITLAGDDARLANAVVLVRALAEQAAKCR